jgi:hypothetical protein
MNRPLLASLAAGGRCSAATPEPYCLNCATATAA